jgi:hypothetical protein
MLKLPSRLSSRANRMAACRVEKSPARRPVVSPMTQAPRGAEAEREVWRGGGRQLARDGNAGHKVERHDTVFLTHLMTLQSYAPSHMNSRGTDDRRHKREIYGTDVHAQSLHGRELKRLASPTNVRGLAAPTKNLGDLPGSLTETSTVLTLLGAAPECFEAGQSQKLCCSLSSACMPGKRQRPTTAHLEVHA